MIELSFDWEEGKRRHSRSTMIRYQPEVIGDVTQGISHDLWATTSMMEKIIIRAAVIKIISRLSSVRLSTYRGIEFSYRTSAVMASTEAASGQTPAYLSYTVHD